MYLRPAQHPDAVAARPSRHVAARAALLGLFAALALAAVPVVAHAAPAVPYTDPSASGFVGLCARSGHPVTSGSIDAAPFAWRAVSSVAAPSGYGVAGRTATLYAYQPRADVAPAQWSGQQLTAASRYRDPAHPTAAATPADAPLADFVAAFPPSWDGLVQLRLYLSAPGHPVDSVSYAATDIRVSGDSWQTVDGGTASCSADRAVSDETLLLPASDLTGAAAAPVSHPVASATGHRSSSVLPGVLGGTALVAVLALVTVLALNRRRSTRSAHPDRSDRLDRPDRVPALTAAGTADSNPDTTTDSTLQKGRQP